MLLSLTLLIFAHVTLFVPGYSLVRHSQAFKKTPSIEVLLGYLLSLMVYGMLATINYSLKPSSLLIQVIAWLFIAIGGVIFIKYGYFDALKRFKFPFICYFLSSMLAVLFVSLPFTAAIKYSPDPQFEANRNYGTYSVKMLNMAHTQANDNYIPYRQAQFFVNRSDPGRDGFISEWYVTFFQRTPLMGAITANYFNLLGEKLPIDYTWSTTTNDSQRTYQQFQVLATVLNSLFLMPAFFLAAKLYSRRVAAISVLFLGTSAYYLYNELFSWPKSFVAFFVLTAWYLLLYKGSRYSLLAGLACGVSYLAHDLTVLYIGATVLLLLYQRRVKDILLYLVPFVVCFLPWQFVASVYYKKASTFVYYPFSTQGIPQPGHTDHLIHDFLHTSPLKLIGIRLQSLFYLLTPYQWIFKENSDLKTRIWANMLYNVPGSIGVGLILQAYIAVVKAPLHMLIRILLPVVFAVVIFGWPDGVGSLHFAQAVVAVATFMAVNLTLKLKSKLWLVFAFFVNALQLVYMVIFSYDFAISAWAHSLRFVAYCLAMLLIVMVAGYYVWKIGADKPHLALQV